MDALGIAGIVVAVITAIAGILALFQGWKCWERRNNTVSSLKNIIRSVIKDLFPLLS